MPIRCFWLLHQNINRISAQEDMRALSISVVCQSKENTLKYRESLELEMGRVFEYRHTMESIRQTEKLDRAGLQRLKTLSSIRK